MKKTLLFSFAFSECLLLEFKLSLFRIKLCWISDFCSMSRLGGWDANFKLDQFVSELLWVSRGFVSCGE